MCCRPLVIKIIGESKCWTYEVTWVSVFWVIGTSNEVGNFVVGVEVLEYRNGNLLGKIRMDLQEIHWYPKCSFTQLKKCKR